MDIHFFENCKIFIAIKFEIHKEIKKRKAAGWAKRTIKSVASWWWLNVHDEKCTDGFDIPDWIKKFPVVKMNETYDELKL